MKKYRLVEGGMLWWITKIAPPTIVVTLAIAAAYIWAGIGLCLE